MNHHKFLPASAAALVPAGICRIRRVEIPPKMNRLAKEKVNGI